MAPVWVGLGILLGYGLLYFGVESLIGLLAGRDPLTWDSPWAGQQHRWELVNGLLVAYTLTASAYAVRSARRDLATLRDDMERPDALRDEVVNVPRAWLNTASALGLFWGAVVAIFDPGIWAGVTRPGPADPIFLWVLFRNVLLAWCGWRMGVTDLVLTRAFSRAAGLVTIDLLDSRGLAPFARQGQRSVLMWTGTVILFSLFWLGGSPARTNSFLLVGIVGAVTGLFLWPMLRVRRRLVAAKAGELERLNERIRSAASRTGPESGSGPRLADWIAYRHLIEGAREWPIKAPALIRSTLLLALAVGSWLGGAVVERLLSVVLD